MRIDNGTWRPGRVWIAIAAILAAVVLSGWDAPAAYASHGGRQARHVQADKLTGRASGHVRPVAHRPSRRATASTSRPATVSTTRPATGSKVRPARAAHAAAHAKAASKSRRTGRHRTASPVTVPAAAGTQTTGAGTAGGSVFHPESTPTITDVTFYTPGSHHNILPAGGSTALIIGTNFSDVATATVGGNSTGTCAVDTPTQARCNIPAGSLGRADVLITTPDGTSVASSGSYINYVAQPVLTNVSPTSAAVGHTVTLTGSGFLGTEDVSFGSTSASFTVDSDTQITTTVPVGATGTVDVVVSLGHVAPAFTELASATGMQSSFTVLSAPPAPANVTATAGDASILVSWDASAGATSYTATADPGPATCTTTTDTSCVLGATAGVTYTVTVVAHNANGDSGPGGPSSSVVPTLPVAPTTPPVTNLVLTTTQGHISTATPGERLVFTGTGFAAYSSVAIRIYSTPVTLGTAVTDVDGAFTLPVTVPASLGAGRHTVVAQGVAPDGTPHAMAAAVTVSTGLPTTGAPLTAIVTTGLLLLVCGAVMRFAARRRTA